MATNLLISELFKSWILNLCCGRPMNGHAICIFFDRMPCTCLGFLYFDHFSHFALFLKMIQKFIVNFPYFAPTQNDLIVDKCRHIHVSSFHYILLEMRIMNQNIQLQNINTKSKWCGVETSCLNDYITLG